MANKLLMDVRRVFFTTSMGRCSKEELFVAKAPVKKTDAKQKTENKGRLVPEKPKMDLGDELLKWSVIPLLHQQKKGIIFGVSTLAFAALVWYAAGLVYSVVAVAISLGASSSFVLPTTYRLCENGVEIRTAASSTIRKWAVFRKYYSAEDGVLLAYYQRSVREKVARGLFLYFGEMDSRQITDILDDRIDQS